ncbi:T9SS type A sorting domain-containing protein [Salinibacter ruber]|uniref:T9SS type A sorting domain-containing protein n=2 Tax=Salinibacter ruber TaxID=146919 RepID=UPI002169173B|nr:T9SS type A sorting domain-containing protein [Salinibacter ruber]
MRDRSLTALLSLLAVFSVGMLPLPLQAQPDISVTIPEVEPTPGQTFTLSIEANLSGEEADAYSNMVFKFDSGVLDIVEVRDGSELSFGSNNLTVNEDGDELRVSNTTSNPVSGDGEFLQIDVELTTGLQNPGTVFRLTPSDPTGVSTSVFEKDGTIFEISSIDQGKVGNLEVQSGRQEGTGSAATVTGTVTRAFGAYVRFQDDSDGNSPSGLTVGPVGDIGEKITKGVRLYVRGTLSEPGGLLRIDDSGLKNHVVLGQGTLPTAQKVSLSQVQSNGENYESELVRVNGLSFQNPSESFSANTTYTVADATTSLAYRVEGGNQTKLIGKSIPKGTFTYTGVVGESGSGSQLVPVRASTALPVTLTGFTAVRNGSSTVLTWRTASETNNAGFRVQYERAAGWEALGFVPSTVDDGTTGEAQSYRFVVDRRLGPGTHRFRLEQVDLDRSTTLSDTVQVEIGMEGALHLSAPAPNPAAERATLSFAVQEGTKAEVTMYDVLGQRVRTLYEGRPPGKEGRRLTVETRDLPSGVYVVRLRAGGRTQTRRLTVVQ